MEHSSSLPAFSMALNRFSGAALTARHVIETSDGTEGRFTDECGNTWSWKLIVTTVCHNGHEGQKVFAGLTLEDGRAEDVNLSVEFMQGQWSEENFVLVPGAAYNANRYASQRIFYPPMLTDPADIGPDVPCIISDIPRLNIGQGPSRFHIRSGDASVPAVGFYAPALRNQQWFLTSQNSGWGDHGLWIKERN